MKKNFIVGIIMGGLIFVFNSQLTALEGGFKFGINKVNLSFSNDDLNAKFASQSEFIYGAFVSFHVSKNLAIQPEMYYSVRGANAISLQAGIDTYRYTYKLSYFEIPLLLKYRFQTRKRISPGIFIGPYVALTGKAKFLRTIDHGEEEQFGEREDIKEYIKNMDFGMVLGGSLEMKSCFGRIILDIRYIRGFVNVVKDKTALSGLYVENSIFVNSQLSDMFTANDSIKNKAFVVMIGVGF